MSVIIAIVPFVIAGSISGISGILALSSEIGENQHTDQKSLTLPTVIRNEQLLRKALVNLGAQNISNTQNNIQGNIDQFHIVFEKTETGLFNIKFVGDIAQQEAEKFVAELHEEYGKVVQDYVYTTLKEKAEEKGLILEQETVQQNQSIVLTFNVNS